MSPARIPYWFVGKLLALRGPRNMIFQIYMCAKRPCTLRRFSALWRTVLPRTLALSRSTQYVKGVGARQNQPLGLSTTFSPRPPRYREIPMSGRGDREASL